jgi:uncharacterized protein with NAD-binding domain and iron-sulfur cluster
MRARPLLVLTLIAASMVAWFSVRMWAGDAPGVWRVSCILGAWAPLGAAAVFRYVRAVGDREDSVFAAWLVRAIGMHFTLAWLVGASDWLRGPPGSVHGWNSDLGAPLVFLSFAPVFAVCFGALAWIASVRARLPREPESAGAHEHATRRAPPDPGAVASLIDTALRYGRLATTAVLFEAADLLRAALESIFPHEYRAADDAVLRLVDVLAAETRRRCHALVRNDPEVGRTWQVIDLILAIVRGALRMGLAFDPRGFDALDEYEWRDWLRLHGAMESSLDSGFVRGIYDLAFAYEDGDPARPRLAASVALRGAMRMFFTYRGSLFWRMSAGMGDIVFAPLYEVLRRRGVRFEFFHRLKNVRLAPAVEGEIPSVEALEFDLQARVREGEYKPLVNVRNVPSWPAEPDWSQLEDGARVKDERRALESPWETRIEGTKTLRVGHDFDLVVLGIPVGAVALACGELIARLPAWAATVREVKTVATQAFQVWMREDMASLGWKHPPVNLSGFVEPFDTWADMGHLLPREDWRTPVRSLAYFCSALPDATVSGEGGEALEARAREVVRANAVKFLSRDVGALWPGAVSAQGGFRWFRWDLLAAEGEGESEGPRRFDTQFWTANVRPSERYSLSVPGSSRYRLSPLDLTVDNLTVAGDWTASGLNTGCVESAVMSGMLAAHALSGAPRLEDIIGYDHP